MYSFTDLLSKITNNPVLQPAPPLSLPSLSPANPWIQEIIDDFGQPAFILLRTLQNYSGQEKQAVIPRFAAKNLCDLLIISMLTGSDLDHPRPDA